MNTSDKVFERGKFFGWHTDGGISVAHCGFNDFSVKNDVINTPRIDYYFTVHLVADGKGTFFIDEYKYNVSKGDMFFLLPNSKISYYPDKKDPWKYYWLNVDSPNISNYQSLLNVSPSHAVFPCPAFEKIQSEFENILDPNSNLTRSGYASIALFYTIVSLLCNNEDTARNLSDTEILERVQSIVDINYSNPHFNVKTIANLLFISHSYLCKKFKEQTGQTLIKYLVNYRLTKACEILEKQKITNKELASAVGFNDEFHFMKVFKKKFGATIKKYKDSFLTDNKQLIE